MDVRARIAEAASFVRDEVGAPPRVAAILGSGLGSADLGMRDATSLPYSRIPHLPAPAVPGHRGELIVGRIGSTRAAVLAGRVHLYEGYTAHEVTFATRVMAALGCEALLVTNASGSTRPDLVPGTLVVITDHLNLTGEDPTRGPEGAALGTRFQGLTEAYDPGLRELIERAAERESIPLARGVYAASKGPCYETPAEVRMLRGMGADLVGMSTVPEVIAANHAGMRAAGLSCVTNLAAGIEGSHPDHEEVEQVAGAASEKLARLYARFVSLYGDA